MKELSIEEKAKAYDEAIEKAKIWQEHLYDVNDKDYADELNYIFPELKESEDERIRRVLREIVLQWKNGHQAWCSDDKEIDTILAWLEKQGEPIDKIVKMAMNEKQRVLLTETNGDANIYWDTRSLQDVKLLLEYGLDYIKKLEKQCEQKPAWSEEDEEEANYIADFIENLIKKEKLVSKKTMIMEEMVAWLRNIKYHYFPQPKQEWSEEDEKILTTIVDYIISDNVLGSKYIDFLKSLRPQSHWKPSEEQLSVLRRFRAVGVQDVRGNDLVLFDELFNSLIKLAE